MGYATVRDGNREHIYQVAFMAAVDCGERSTVKCRFGAKDGWVQVAGGWV
jgi:hypothetical protein